MDYITQLDYMGLTARIKRINDRLLVDGRNLYKDLGSEVEPNWYLIFKVIMDKGASSITDITNELNFAHPSIIAIVKKMEAKGYLDICPDKVDKRKQIISLSDKAQSELPKMKKIWNACERAIQAIFIDDKFLGEFNKFEQALIKTSFKDRVIRELDNHNFKIVDYKPKYAKAFGDLNKEWINQHFVLEDIDLQVLDHPDEEIINKGGKIMMVLDGRKPIGAVALIRVNDDLTELSKMGMAPNYRGRGIGSLLIKRAIQEAKFQDYSEIILYSNTVLAPAIHLYYKFGFEKMELEPDSVYKRSNIKMGMKL